MRRQSSKKLGTTSNSKDSVFVYLISPLAGIGRCPLIRKQRIILVDGLDANGEGRSVELSAYLSIETCFEKGCCFFDDGALGRGLGCWEDGAEGRTGFCVDESEEHSSYSCNFRKRGHYQKNEKPAKDDLYVTLMIDTLGSSLIYTITSA